MALLLCCSAFFSTSEAALFYLRRSERRRLAAGNRSQRIAAGLLGDPDRLLTAVLFWNLLVNLAYCAVAAVVGIRLETGGRAAAAGAFSVAALIVIIVCGEMLPKSLAVLKPRTIASAGEHSAGRDGPAVGPLAARLPHGQSAVAAAPLAAIPAGVVLAHPRPGAGGPAVRRRRRTGRAGAAGAGEHRAALGDSGGRVDAARGRSFPRSVRPSRWTTSAAGCRPAATCW